MMTAAPTITCELNLPNREHFFAQIEENAKVVRRTATANSRLGRTVSICGAGPSLADECESMEPTDEVWACNSSLPYLWDRSVRVTHGVTIDQHEMMLADHEFGRCLPVMYLLASSVHPNLVKRLMAHHRPITFFHSYLGIDNPEGWEPPKDKPQLSYEMFLYTKRFPTSVMAGHGLNSVPRAICLAMAMGFETIYVYGADCAAKQTDEPMPPRNDGAAYMEWLTRLTFYADGRPASVYGNTPIAEGVIDGRAWHTRADMVISAQHLLDLQREYKRAFNRQVVFVGDTLVAAMEQHADDEEWMKRLPKLEQRGQVSNFALLHSPEEYAQARSTMEKQQKGNGMGIKLDYSGQGTVTPPAAAKEGSPSTPVEGESDKE